MRNVSVRPFAFVTSVTAQTIIRTPIGKTDIILQFNFCVGEGQSSDAGSVVNSAVSASNLAIRSRYERVHRFNSSDN